MFLITTSTCFLNVSKDGDSTVSMGSLFHCFTTYSVKNIFLISTLTPTFPPSTLNATWGHFLFFLLLFAWRKRPTATSLQPPLKYVCRVIRSPLSFLISSLKTPAPFISFITLVWTYMSTSVSFLKKEAQNWTQHFRCKVDDTIIQV